MALRNVISLASRSKVVKVASFGVLTVGTGCLISYLDLHPIRSVRVFVTTVSIIIDYKWTFRKFAVDTPDYEKELSETHSRSAIKLYDLCCKNRGTYIKVGQLLGALDYFLPHEYTSVLRTFHDDAPQSSFEEISKIVKEDLGINSLHEVFSDFSQSPIGTASLGQVHKATLLSTGEMVAVKVQHPKVREQANFDMLVMEKATRQAAKYFPDFKMIWLAEETKKHLPLELDYLHEGKNAEKVMGLLKCFEWVKIPKVFWEVSTERVLVMEYCEGGQVNDLEYFKKNNIDCNHVSRMLGKLYSELIFVNGFVHCDPHPGNLLVRKRSEEERRKLEGSHSRIGWLRRWFPTWLGGIAQSSEIELIVLDHGLYQTLDDHFRYQYAGLWQSIINADIDGIKKHSDAFGVGDMYPLFATMLTVRSWEVVSEKGIKSTKFSNNEDREIRTGVPSYLPGISKILNQVPRPMVMLFKTNDLLRMLEGLHGTRSHSSGFLSMSRCCLRAIRDYEAREEEPGSWRKIAHSFALQVDLAKISIYEWFMWISSLLSPV